MDQICRNMKNTFQITWLLLPNFIEYLKKLQWRILIGNSSKLIPLVTYQETLISNKEEKSGFMHIISSAKIVSEGRETKTGFLADRLAPLSKQKSYDCIK